MKNIKFAPILALISLTILWSCGPSVPAHNHDHSAETEAEHAAHSTDEGHQGHDHPAEATAEHVHSSECGDHATETSSDHATETHIDEIIFTPAQAAAAGLETEIVQAAPFESVIKTSGQIVSPTGDMATIAATTAGIVSFANRSIAIGQAVNKGQVIAHINSAKIEAGDAVAKARATYANAKAALDRGKNLAADNIISQKDLEQLQLNYNNAKIGYDAFAGSISDGGVNITAPIGGYIQNIVVNQGDYVAVGQSIATIVQNRRVQLRAQVSQKHFQNLQNVKSASFVTPYDKKVYKTGEMNGTMISQGKSLDGSSFYIPIVFEMNNIGNLIPGSFVEVFLLSAPAGAVVSVPKGAIVEQQGVYYVFVQLDQEGFERREVELGANNGDRIEIISGLNNGEKVVTKGAMQVKLAATSSVIPEGHVH